MNKQGIKREKSSIKNNYATKLVQVDVEKKMYIGRLAAGLTGAPNGLECTVRDGRKVVKHAARRHSQIAAAEHAVGDQHYNIRQLPSGRQGLVGYRILGIAGTARV